MHVLFFHLYFNLPEGTGTNRQYRFCRRLLQRGHSVTVVSSISFRSGGLEPGVHTYDDIRVQALDLRYRPGLPFLERLRFFFAYNRQALRWAARHVRPDVVFSSSTPLTIGVPGYRAARRFGVPFVFEVRDLWPHIPIELGLINGTLPRLAARALERRIYRRSDAIIALSPGFVDGIAQAGYPRERIHLIPNGAELDRFDPEAHADDLRHRHGWTGDVVVLHPGTMGYVNGLTYILDAARLLRDEAPELRFVLIGTGPQRAALEQQISEQHLTNVTMLDPMPRAEVTRYWHLADLGLMAVRPEPALFMNSANKFFENLAAGRPVVMNYPGWQADWLRRYDAGASTPPGDARALANALLHLARHPDDRRTMGRNARRLAEDQFDAARQSDQFVDLLERMVQDRERSVSRNG